MSAPAPLWSLWDVSIMGFPPVTYSAPSRGRAIAMAWRDYQNYDDSISFKAFLRILTSARPRDLPLGDDGYGYVRRAYNVNPKIDCRVALTEREGSEAGREGVIIYPGRATADVHVVLDGEDHPVRVHPLHLRPVGSGW